MNMRRIGVLLGKEFRYGTRDFMFIYSLIVPIVMSALLSMTVGNIFSQQPRIGIYDMGDSIVTQIYLADEHINTRIYDNAETLQADVEQGIVEMGLVLPANFDEATRANEGEAAFDLYTWSQALVTHQAILGMGLVKGINELVEREEIATVELVPLGETNGMTWSERLLPFVILITMLMGGAIVPAMSLVEEKERHTLGAVTITPTSLADVFAAKALLGIITSTIMAGIVIVINQAFGISIAVLGVIFLGTISAALFGVILGMMSSDTNSLIAVVKTTGILLYAPAIVHMVPSIPQWIGRIFPTYYIINPITEMSLYERGFGDVWLDVVILAALIGLLTFGAGIVMERQEKKMALAS